MTHLDDLLSKSNARVITGLEPGDILHVRVGIPDMGDGLPPWIPTLDELATVQEEFESGVPDGVKVITTHFGVDAHVNINLAVLDLRDEETESQFIQYLRGAGVRVSNG